ncbi:MAG: KEOPS complex subunit Cgi121 [Candidatus Bathyarchaeia archaeon]
MIEFKLKDYRKRLLIINLLGAKIRDIDHAIKKFKGDLGEVEVQFFDSKKIAGWEHLYFAALNALKAFRNKNNISKSLSMELLLYASAERQIKDAIQKIGIEPNGKEITVAIVIDEKAIHEDLMDRILSIVNGKLSETGLEEWSKDKVKILKDTFKISNLELNALKRKGMSTKEIVKKLIIERMAILSIKA